MQTDPFAATPQPIHLPGVPDQAVTSYVKFMDGGDLLDIPVHTVKWRDERETCKTVREYLAGQRQGVPEDWQGCSSLRRGVCMANGEGPCLFQEPDDSAGWQRARQWEEKTMEDGRSVLVLKASSAPQDGAS